MAEHVDIDQLISQLAELSRTRLDSRAEELRRLIQAQIDSLLQEDGSEEEITPEIENASKPQHKMALVSP